VDSERSVIVDCDQLWREAMQSASWRMSGGAKRWELRAAIHQDRVQLGSYRDFVEHVMALVKIDPDETILDVGCGPGTLAIPLAARARSVTCLDISSAMLEQVQHNAEINALGNLNYLNKAWEDVTIGEELAIHDVVIASRFVPHELSRDLRKLQRAARKRVYLIWGTGIDHIDEYVYQLLGRPYRAQPGYIFPYAALYQMGIQADVTIFQSEHSYHYGPPAMDKAMADWKWGLGDLTPGEENTLKKHLMRHRNTSEDVIELKSPVKQTWAVIHWNVNRSDELYMPGLPGQAGAPL